MLRDCDGKRETGTSEIQPEDRDKVHSIPDAQGSTEEAILARMRPGPERDGRDAQPACPASRQ